MKLTFLIMFSRTLEIILTVCANVPISSLPIVKRDGEIVGSIQKRVHNPTADISTPTSKRIRTGTHSNEEEERKRKKQFSEMGKKGGLATNFSFLKKANGDPRLAKKLRSNATKENMKIRQKVHSEEVGKIRYAESNDAYLARFKASESKAK